MEFRRIQVFIRPAKIRKIYKKALLFSFSFVIVYGLDARSNEIIMSRIEYLMKTFLTKSLSTSAKKLKVARPSAAAMKRLDNEIAIMVRKNDSICSQSALLSARKTVR